MAIVAGTSLPARLAVWSADDRPSAVASSQVPPVQDEPRVRIAVTGDTGTGTAAEHRTARRMDLLGRDRAHDALVLLGDLVYEDGDAELVDEVVLEPFAPVLARGAELVPVLGNHDYRSGEQGRILQALGRTDSWYVAEVGPVRLVVLDSERVEDGEQTRWLRATLAEGARAGRWTVVAMHHPAFSAGYHGSHREVRRRWVPLFEGRVPLVLAGHDHDYQRSRVLDGVTYVVSGAGAKLRPTGQRDFTAVSSSTLHFLDLLFYDDHLVGRAIDQSGGLLDLFTIARPGGPR